jgi:hypothetical protein
VHQKYLPVGAKPNIQMTGFEAGITIATVEMKHAWWSFRLISKPVVADLSVEHALKIITVATFLR